TTTLPLHDALPICQQVTHDLLERAGIPATRVEAQGESRLAQQMTAMQFGDYVSFYLAMIYEVDPTPIDDIAWLKDPLSGSSSAPGRTTPPTDSPRARRPA